MLGFGLDLAGYTTGKTSFAAVERRGRKAEAIVFTDCVFSRGFKRKSDYLLTNATTAEVDIIRRCLHFGHLAVDVPIDLQNVTKPDRAKRIWELTYRPIDKAFNALPPLADRIGAAVARFSAIMNAGDFNALLGQSIFETYPEGVWRQLQYQSRGYKGKSGKQARERLCSRWNIAPLVSNDDDIDAVISAIAASASPSELCDDNYYSGLLMKLGDGYHIPRGYRLAKILPKTIRVSWESFETWILRREALEIK